jgi:hypothetical protein
MQALRDMAQIHDEVETALAAMIRRELRLDYWSPWNVPEVRAACEALALSQGLPADAWLDVLR